MEGNWVYRNRYLIGVGVALAVVGVVVYMNRDVIGKKVTAIKEEKYKEVKDAIQSKVWDSISERNIDTLHPMIREKAREFINKAEKDLGIKLRVVSALRTYDEQNKLYAKGRTAPGSIVTNAKGGQSNHNFGTAFDVAPVVNGQVDWKSKDWDKIGAVGKSVGFNWGGDWKGLVDRPHFEMQFGNTLAQLKQKYESGQRDGNYVKLI